MQVACQKCRAFLSFSLTRTVRGSSCSDSNLGCRRVGKPGKSQEVCVLTSRISWWCRFPREKEKRKKEEGWKKGIVLQVDQFSQFMTQSSEEIKRLRDWRGCTVLGWEGRVLNWSLMKMPVGSEER